MEMISWLDVERAMNEDMFDGYFDSTSETSIWRSFGDYVKMGQLGDS